MLSFILNLFVFGVCGWVTWNYVAAYRATTGLWYERALAASKNSLTILWGQVVIVAAAILNGIGAIADVLDAGAGEQIKSAIPVQYAAAAIVIIAGISIIARLRRALWPQG